MKQDVTYSIQEDEVMSIHHTVKRSAVGIIVGVLFLALSLLILPCHAWADPPKASDTQKQAGDANASTAKVGAASESTVNDTAPSASEENRCSGFPSCAAEFAKEMRDEGHAD